MPALRVLVVAKKSAFETYFNEYQERPLRRLVRRGDKALLGIQRSHNTHYQTLSRVKAALQKRSIPFRVCFRGQSFDPKNHDLVISVGGDGTFLEASRSLSQQRILGVNSDQTHSVGKLCAAHEGNFEKCLDRILRGDFKIKSLNRMKIFFNGKALDFFVLNDILISHACPAAMSHYVLKVGAHSERQRSSGVWVSTAAGSTAVMCSAGGRAMAEESTHLQYLPRELFSGHGYRYRLTGGTISRGKSLWVTSQMQEGRLYLDGAHRWMPFKYGDCIRILSGTPLKAIHFRPQ